MCLRLVQMLSRREGKQLRMSHVLVDRRQAELESATDGGTRSANDVTVDGGGTGH